MIKKLAFLFLFAVSAELLVACCNCGVSVDKKYTHKSFSLSHLDNSGAEPVLIKLDSIVYPLDSVLDPVSLTMKAVDSVVYMLDSIAKPAFGIRLNMNTELLTVNQFQVPSLFTAPAYAMHCECEPPLKYFPKDSITDLQIFTVYAFDTIHPDSSEITSYFKFYNGNFSEPYRYTTIQKFLASTGRRNYSEQGELINKYDFLLTESPPLSGKGIHKFIVKVYLSDGRKEVVETLPIMLK
ncbi:MAG: DUF5034 domain-containing protein [Bacteroidota bacterium]